MAEEQPTEKPMIEGAVYKITTEAGTRSYRIISVYTLLGRTRAKAWTWQEGARPEFRKLVTSDLEHAELVGRGGGGEDEQIEAPDPVQPERV
jgi:hypothetical protein